MTGKTFPNNCPNAGTVQPDSFYVWCGDAGPTFNPKGTGLTLFSSASMLHSATVCGFVNHGAVELNRQYAICMRLRKGRTLLEFCVPFTAWPCCSRPKDLAIRYFLDAVLLADVLKNPFQLVLNYLLRLCVIRKARLIPICGQIRVKATGDSEPLGIEGQTWARTCRA